MIQLDPFIRRDDKLVVGLEANFTKLEDMTKWVYARQTSASLHTFACGPGDPRIRNLITTVLRNIMEPELIDAEIAERRALARSFAEEWSMSEDQAHAAAGADAHLRTIFTTGPGPFSDAVLNQGAGVRVLGIYSFSGGHSSGHEFYRRMEPASLTMGIFPIGKSEDPKSYVYVEHHNAGLWLNKKDKPDVQRQYFNNDLKAVLEPLHFENTEANATLMKALEKAGNFYSTYVDLNATVPVRCSSISAIGHSVGRVSIPLLTRGVPTFGLCLFTLLSLLIWYHRRSQAASSLVRLQHQQKQKCIRSVFSLRSTTTMAILRAAVLIFLALSLALSSILFATHQPHRVVIDEPQIGCATTSSASSLFEHTEIDNPPLIDHSARRSRDDDDATGNLYDGPISFWSSRQAREVFAAYLLSGRASEKHSAASLGSPPTAFDAAQPRGGTLQWLADRGIVMAIALKHLTHAVTTVRQLRELGCTMPILVVHTDLPQWACDLLAAHNGTTVTEARKAILGNSSPPHPPELFAGYPIKVLALVTSPFRQTLLIDPDVFWVRERFMARTVCLAARPLPPPPLPPAPSLACSKHH